MAVGNSRIHRECNHLLSFDLIVQICSNSLCLYSKNKSMNTFTLNISLNIYCTYSKNGSNIDETNFVTINKLLYQTELSSSLKPSYIR